MYMKLTKAQIRVIYTFFNSKGISDSVVNAFAQTRTLKKLESEGLLQFYPFSKMDKDGVWKITQKGKLYCIKCSEKKCQ